MSFDSCSAQNGRKTMTSAAARSRIWTRWSARRRKSAQDQYSAAGCMQQTREEAKYEIESMRSELQAVRSAHAGPQGQIGNATARLQVSPGKGNWTAALRCPTMLCEHLQQLGAEGPSRLLQQPDAAMSLTVAGKLFIARDYSTVAQRPRLVVMTLKHV